MRKSIQLNEKNAKIVLLIFKFVLNYMKYLFLTTTIVLTAGAILFIILTLNSNFSFEFLKYFGFIINISPEGNISLKNKDIIALFSLFSLIVMSIVSLIKFVIEKTTNKKIIITIKTKAKVLFSVLTFIYSLTILITIFNPELEYEIIFIFLLFYFVSLPGLAIYIIIETLIEKINLR